MRLYRCKVYADHEHARVGVNKWGQLSLCLIFLAFVINFERGEARGRKDFAMMHMHEGERERVSIGLCSRSLYRSAKGG